MSPTPPTAWEISRNVSRNEDGRCADWYMCGPSTVVVEVIASFLPPVSANLPHFIFSSFPSFFSLNVSNRAVSLVVGYLGILVGLFHKILFGGSVSRQKASVKVRKAFAYFFSP